MRASSSAAQPLPRPVSNPRMSRPRYTRQAETARAKANSPAMVDMRLPPMMLKARSKMKGSVAAPVRAGPGNGRSASRPRAHPAAGMTTRPATVTHFMARP